MAAILAGTGANFVSTATTTSGTALAMPKPSVLYGPSLLAAVVTNQVSSAGTSWTPPSGWTLAASLIGTSARTTELWVKPITAPGSEPATYTFTAPSSGRNAGALFSVLGAATNPSTVVDGRGLPAATSTTLIGPSVTPSQPGCLALLVAMIANSSAGQSTMTPPAGWTTVATVGTGGTAGTATTNLLVAARSLPSVAATGSATVSASPAPDSSRTAFQAVLRPVPAGWGITL